MTAPEHHDGAGGFRNPWPGSHTPTFGDVARWMLWERLIHPLPPQPDASVFPRATPSFPQRVNEPGLALTWVGHSTFLLQLDGVNILTDPVWSRRASPFSFSGPARWVPPIPAFEALPSIDVVLLSHNHYDHLDDSTVRRIAEVHPEAKWFVPLGLARFLAKRAVQHVCELDWWSESALGTLRLSCTPAKHGSARGLGDRSRTLWCSWNVLTPAKRVHFGGDTAYHPEFGRIGHAYGPFDVALLPIGAYEPRWFMRHVHMNARESVQAYRELCAPHRDVQTKFVPMHWGTFKLTDEPMDEPPRAARAAWEEAALPDADFWLLAHGETRRL